MSKNREEVREIKGVTVIEERKDRERKEKGRVN